jgi:hypothetical protein
MQFGMRTKKWVRLLACATGTVNQELLRSQISNPTAIHRFVERA